MAAKNKHPGRNLDFHGALTVHVEASAKAHAWAERCLTLRQAGKAAQAKAAEAKAKFWLSKAMTIEVLAEHGKPEVGRRPEYE